MTNRLPCANESSVNHSGVNESTTVFRAECEAASPSDGIRIVGARVHNLRDLHLTIPHDSLVVLTGVSGSGKSSLAFDTVFAEGQRRYLESLSTYTRQFLDQLERPDVDLIEGLPPTISIEQRSGSASLRSTLATTTEIYDFLRLLFARAGTAHCPQCGQPVSQQSAQQIVDRILNLEERRKVMILAPVVRGRKGTHRHAFEMICREGFVRARVDGDIVDAADPPELKKGTRHDIEAVIDRIIVKEGIRSRLQESVELALKLGDGVCLISDQQADGWHDRLFSAKLACPACDLSFPDLEPRSFSFNSPYGACPECDGLGVLSTDPSERPRKKQNIEADWHLRPNCPACDGSRLHPFPRAVQVAGQTISEWAQFTVAEMLDFAEKVQQAVEQEEDPEEFAENEVDSFTPEGRLAARSILPEIVHRVRFLNQVGLDYLNLNRSARTLSGGEFQRARLAGCLGSGLTGVCYILDEPTIGLHPRDTGRLIDTLEELRHQGNSVLVVEHDPEMMRRADWLIDLGPGAGSEGGRVIAAGTPEEIADNPNSISGRFLRPSDSPQTTSSLRTPDWSQSLVVRGARLHNLRNVTCRIPLGVFTCVTGVSGSGKSSLISQTLVPALRRRMQGENVPLELLCDHVEGAEHLDRLIEVDQSPIGRSGRSNPATYSGIWDEVRKVFSRTREARLRGYTARRFSFNARDGRCEECDGRGTRRIEMHFMPDMFVVCPRCRGARFNRQTLSIRYRGKSVADVLAMRIEEAAEFFENFSKLRRLLQTFADVGLGYLSLGQSAPTLSGGEAQRVKLASELGKSSDLRTLFVLDEPTTGLHPADVDQLLQLLNRLVDQGHTVLVIEHHVDVMRSADWLIDLGPDGGSRGGHIVSECPPGQLAQSGRSFTASALRLHWEVGHTNS